jgi:hypothetical protein
MTEIAEKLKLVLRTSYGPHRRCKSVSGSQHCSAAPRPVGMFVARCRVGLRHETLLGYAGHSKSATIGAWSETANHSSPVSAWQETRRAAIDLDAKR